MALIAFPWASAPCPALTKTTLGFVCGLVLIERENGLPPEIERRLGIGTGCSMPDAETTDAERQEFHLANMLKIYGKVC